jgi:hypothetical protein
MRKILLTPSSSVLLGLLKAIIAKKFRLFPDILLEI